VSRKIALGVVTAISVAVAPDGGWLASGGWDGTVRIWDVATRRERVVLVGHNGPVSAVAVAPDSSWLASGGADGTVRIWDVATEREQAVLTGHTGRVFAVAVAPDGSWLVSGGFDMTVRIWEAPTGPIRTLMRVDSNIIACAWVGSNGLVLGGPAGLYLFDFLTGSSPTAAKA